MLDKDSLNHTGGLPSTAEHTHTHTFSYFDCKCSFTSMDDNGNTECYTPVLQPRLSHVGVL